MTTANLPAARPWSEVPAVDLTDPLGTLQSAMALSDALARSELVPRALSGRPANIFHVIMTGDRLNLHWTESLRVIYSAGPGTIGLRGSFLLAQLRKAGHRYSMAEAEGSCTFRMTRGDTEEQFEATFTIDDAILAGLAQERDGRIMALSREGKPLPWMQYTRRMLRWRAVADCVGFGAPEVALGFEIEGGQPEEPQPEVTLRPGAPAPPEPGAGEAAAGNGQAAQAEQLAKLDRDMRPGLEARENQPMGGNPAPGDDEGPGAIADPAPAAPAAAPPAGTSATSPAEAAGRGRRVLEGQLAQAFTGIGWGPERHRADMLRACSMFAGRRITSVRELQPAEILQLQGELEKLAGRHSPEPVVALADQVEAWKEKFAETDPAGYEQYEHGH